MLHRSWLSESNEKAIFHITGRFRGIREYLTRKSQPFLMSDLFLVYLADEGYMADITVKLLTLAQVMADVTSLNGPFDFVNITKE